MEWIIKIKHEEIINIGGILLNKIAVNNSKKDIDTLNKVVSLFKFIEEINKLKQKIILK